MSTQPEFATALLDGRHPAPPGLSDPMGRPAGRRFDVYRNNVAVGLTEALDSAFPVVRALVGAEFFTAMAGVFLRAHPPRSPLMMYYGGAMPGFLERFPPVAHLRYLPDVARLELALRHAYHAADAAPLDAGALNSLSAGNLMQMRLTLAPAVQVLRSDHPVASIWLAHQTSPVVLPRPAAEELLITRPGFDPQVHILPPGGFSFIKALQAGKPLSLAHQIADSEFHNFNISECLGLLLSGQAILSADHEV